MAAAISAPWVRLVATLRWRPTTPRATIPARAAVRGPFRVRPTRPTAASTTTRGNATTVYRLAKAEPVTKPTPMPIAMVEAATRATALTSELIDPLERGRALRRT